MSTTHTAISSIKTFTLKRIEHKIVSGKKGLLTYHLVDENNAPRKIASVTSLDRKKKIKDLRAIYSREVPLVNALTGLRPNQTVTVDFNDFNKTFKRSSTKRTGDAYAENALLEVIYSNSYLLPTVIKYSTIATGIYLLFLGYLHIASSIKGGW